MRLILLACCLGLAGCGLVSPDEHVVDPGAPKLSAREYGPRQANPAVRSRSRARTPSRRPLLWPRRSTPARSAWSTRAGTSACGRRTLETSSDAALQAVRWQRWDAAGASGTGRLRVLVCQPTCATGRGRVAPATVELSSVRECGGRSYFDAAEVTVRGEQPVVYVRAPC